MSTYVNYSSLVADVTNYLERGGSSSSDPTVAAQVPRLINAAERKLAQVLKLLGQIESFTDPTGLAANLPIIQKPDRWRQTVSMNYGAGTLQNFRVTLLPRSLEYCNSYWPDRTQIAPPLFYADYDFSHWLITPTPDISYPLEVVAYMQPQYLDSNNQNNFWTFYTPNALLYGTLLEAAPFLKNDDRIPVWKGFWDLEIQTLQTQDLQRQFDRAAMRSFN
jgi:hypothetical protein